MRISPIDMVMTAMMPLVDEPEFMAWWISIGMEKRLEIMEKMAELIAREVAE